MPAARLLVALLCVLPAAPLEVQPAAGARALTQAGAANPGRGDRRATISSRGCVQGLEVMRSVDPALDFAALSAVMLWRYLPGRVNDHTTPAIMNVLVNFSLP